MSNNFDLTQLEKQIDTLSTLLDAALTTQKQLKGELQLVQARMNLAGVTASPALVQQRLVMPTGANQEDKRSRLYYSAKQQKLIEDLCEQKFARVEGLRNMLDASQIIDQLFKLEDVPADKRDLTSVPSASQQIQPTPPPVEPEPVKDKIDMNILRMIPDGRYAVSSDDSTQTVFLKLATRKTKHGEAFRDLRYKSSDAWLPLQRFWQGGQVTGRNSVHGSTVADLLTQVMMDKAGCADRYGERFKECVNCGRELTDDRSRYYRLGTECIQRRPEIVEYIDQRAGVWQPGAASRD